MAKTTKSLSRNRTILSEQHPPASIGKFSEYGIGFSSGVHFAMFDLQSPLQFLIEWNKDKPSLVSIVKGSNMMLDKLSFSSNDGLSISQTICGEKPCDHTTGTESKQTNHDPKNTRKQGTRSSSTAPHSKNASGDVSMTDVAPQSLSAPTDRSEAKVEVPPTTPPATYYTIDAPIDHQRSIICTGSFTSVRNVQDLVSACIDQLNVDPMEIQRFHTDSTTCVLQFRTAEQCAVILQNQGILAQQFPGVFLRPFQQDFPTIGYKDPSLKKSLDAKHPCHETAKNSIFLHMAQPSTTLNVWLEAETLGMVRRVRPTRVTTCFVVNYFDTEVVAKLLAGTEKFPSGYVHPYKNQEKRQHWDEITSSQPPEKRTRAPPPTAAHPPPIGGANRAVAIHLSNTPSIQHPLPSEIQQNWDQDPTTGNWKPGTKVLQNILRMHQPPQITVEVRGDGNCAYRAFKRSAKLHMSISHIKQSALNFVERNESRITANFQQMGLDPNDPANADWTVPALKHALRTPGIYANEPALNTLAWAFHRNIDLFDTMTGVKWLSIPAEPPWIENDKSPQSSRHRPSRATFPTVQLAHLRHRIYCVYNSSFEPLGAAEGHFWAIVDAPLNRWRSAPLRP